MKLSAIVLDIDGTLLNPEWRVSDANLSALRKCVQMGILVYVATARPKRLVFRSWEATGEASFISEKGAFYNGAVAIDSELDFVKHWLISPELVHSITDYLVDMVPDIQIAIQHKETYHSFRLPADEELFADWGFPPEECIPFPQASRQDCSKIVVWREDMNLREVYNELLKRYGNKINAYLTDSGMWIQIMVKEAKKEQAIMELISLRGIPPEEVVVFGDDIPDLGMFKTFGHSVAMGNSKQALKDAATFITKSNAEDGVAYAIENYFGII